MRKVNIIILLLFTVTCTLSTVHAAESTPSADIKAQLEQLKIEIASKAAKLKDEINRKLKDRAYIGKLKTKSENSLTIASKSGPKIITINQDTEYITAPPASGGKIKGKKFSL